jgi:signal transduction histidine kinase
MPARHWALLCLYSGTAILWLITFPLDVSDLEPYDIGFAAAGLLFAGATALVLLTLRLPVLEVGWGVFAFSYFIRLLDELAEGPESLESILPGTIAMAGLGIILLGFVRTTGRLRSDLSERKERLLVLNRVLRHNLRNNLTTIIGSLERMQATAADEETAQFAEIGMETARELSDTSGKIQRMDRVLETADRHEPTVWDVSEVAEDVVRDIREAYPSVSLELRTEGETRARTVGGVEATLANVIENACEHNDAADPRVVVTVEPADGGTVAVTVRDNGSGIPDHELEPLRAGEETTLSHGSGVGLWFVLWVVERSSGDVAFDYDGGQIVTVRFPATDERHGWRKFLQDLLER